MIKISNIPFALSAVLILATASCGTSVSPAVPGAVDTLEDLMNTPAQSLEEPIAQALPRSVPLYATDTPNSLTATLRVLHYQDPGTMDAAEENREIWDEFSRLYPNITLIRENLSKEAFHKKTAEYVAAGKVPDVLYMWPAGVSNELHKNKLVKDLMYFLEQENMVGDFIPAALAPQAEGYLAELPIGVTFTHLFYANDELLARNGQTSPASYKELRAMAPVLKAKGLQTAIMSLKDDWVGQSCLFSMIVGRMGGRKFVDDCIAGRAKFTDKVFVDSLRIYRNMFVSGVIAPEALDTAYGSSPYLFANGAAPFMIDGDWRTGAFLTDRSTGAALIPVEKQPNIALTVFPPLPGEKYPNTTSCVVGTGYGISSALAEGSIEERAAWELVKFLQSEAVQKARFELGLTFPSRKGIAFPQAEPLTQTRAKTYAEYKSTYVLDAVLPSQVFACINKNLADLAKGKVTPQQAAAAVDAEMAAFR